MANLEKEYRSGVKTTEEYKEAKKQITEKFKNTRKLKEETERILEQSKNQIKLSNKSLGNLSTEISKRAVLNKLQNVAIDLLSKMGDLGKHIAELRFPDWEDVLKKGVDNFLEYDKTAFGLRKSMGLLRGDFDILQKNAKTLGVELVKYPLFFEQMN